MADRAPRRWFGAELDALREAYLDRRLRLKVVAHMFGTAQYKIHRLAVKHGWPRRCHPEGIANIRAAARARLEAR